jgi:hypothetical protein
MINGLNSINFNSVTAKSNKRTSSPCFKGTIQGGEMQHINANQSISGLDIMSNYARTNISRKISKDAKNSACSFNGLTQTLNDNFLSLQGKLSSKESPFKLDPKFKLSEVVHSIGLERANYFLRGIDEFANHVQEVLKTQKKKPEYTLEVKPDTFHGAGYYLTLVPDKTGKKAGLENITARYSDLAEIPLDTYRIREQLEKSCQKLG